MRKRTLLEKQKESAVARKHIGSAEIPRKGS